MNAFSTKKSGVFSVIGNFLAIKKEVIYKLFRVLGLLHEHQSRKDRDEYVTIKWENIHYGKSLCFLLLNIKWLNFFIKNNNIMVTLDHQHHITQTLSKMTTHSHTWLPHWTPHWMHHVQLVIINLSIEKNHYAQMIFWNI